MKGTSIRFHLLRHCIHQTAQLCAVRAWFLILRTYISRSLPQYRLIISFCSYFTLSAMFYKLLMMIFILLIILLKFFEINLRYFLFLLDRQLLLANWQQYWESFKLADSYHISIDINFISVLKLASLFEFAGDSCTVFVPFEEQRERVYSILFEVIYEE